MNHGGTNKANEIKSQSRVFVLNRLNAMQSTRVLRRIDQAQRQPPERQAWRRAERTRSEHGHPVLWALILFDMSNPKKVPIRSGIFEIVRSLHPCIFGAAHPSGLDRSKQCSGDGKDDPSQPETPPDRNRHRSRDSGSSHSVVRQLRAGGKEQRYDS
jgi:hypothetical protein